MNLSRLCKGVRPYCKKIKSQKAFVKEMLKAAGNGYISDSYAKQLYSGGKPFTDELKSGFASTDRTQELITFFEENITDEEGVIIDFGIPEKTDCNKKALCVALTRQMQELINGTDDVDDILAMTYEAEKTNNSEEITGALPQPLYMGDSVNAFYNRIHVIQSYEKVIHQWEMSFFHWEKRKFSGVSTQIHRRIKGALTMAKRSGASFATLLGVISPKIRTTTVTTTVEIVAPMSP